MKFILASLFLSSILLAAPQNEIEVLEELISTTQKNLEGQQKVLTKMKEFLKAREDFLENFDSSKLATALVKQAIQLQRLLSEEHLNHLFSIDFLTELTFYNQVGKNSVISIPHQKSVFTNAKTPVINPS